MGALTAGRGVGRMACGEGQQGQPRRASEETVHWPQEHPFPSRTLSLIPSLPVGVTALFLQGGEWTGQAGYFMHLLCAPHLILGWAQDPQQAD